MADEAGKRGGRIALIVVTVVLMVTFVAIWAWAWRRRHRATFQRMAALPMEDGAPDGEEQA